MKRYLLVTTVLTGFVFVAAAGVAAEPPGKPAAEAAHHDHAAVPAAPAEAAKGGMAMGKGMGAGGGMCAMMSGGAMAPMGGMGTMMTMGGADTQVTVKNTDTGVTITLTAKDPGKIARLQKMAEAMRLMHEATGQ